jgi:hypothetical protein
VRLLFLGNSDDLNPEIPEDQRSPSITGQLLESLTGEPWEVTARTVWPTPDLPDLVERWLDRYQPDVVLFKITWFWWGFESVPVRIERVLGPLGKPIATLGLRAAATPRIGHTRPFKLGRRLAHRVIGGDAPFAPEHVIETVEACIRPVLAREGIVLLVKGTATYDLGGEPMIQDYTGRFAARRDHVEGALQAHCQRLNVAWADNRETAGREHEGLDRGDGLHKAVPAQQLFAQFHARDLLAAMESAGWTFHDRAAAPATQAAVTP